jgi:hypothetical protein
VDGNVSSSMHVEAQTLIWGGRRLKGDISDAGRGPAFRKPRHNLSDWINRYHKGGACAHLGKE